MACSTTPVRASTVAATRSIASRARSGLLTLTFDISQSRNPRNWAMLGGSNGYRAALVRRQLTPGLISSLRGTAGLPPFISFSTSYPELDSAVFRHMDNERLVGQPDTIQHTHRRFQHEEIFSRYSRRPAWTESCNPKSPVRLGMEELS